MIDPDSAPSSALWAVWLSLWGACVAYLQRIKDSGPRSFSAWVLVIEILTSMFVGYLTYLAADFQGLDERVTAAMAGTNGYLGTRALGALRKAVKLI